jgi:anti-sigma-K factor RskA
MAAKKREDLLNLIPAYAIGALDENERAEFEAWLQYDPEAQAILADYQAVADHLVALAPFRPAPGHLRADLLQRLATSADVAAKPVEKQPGTIQRSLRHRSTWIFAAAALFTVVILGVLLMQLYSTNDSYLTEAAKLYARLKAQSGSSQYAVVAGEVDDEVSGNLVVSPDGRQAVLCLWDLPPITDEQTFQMWLVDNHSVWISGGLFQADTPEDWVYLQVPLVQYIAAYQGIGVSLEPAGGSPYADQPTGPRVLSVPLNQGDPSPSPPN